MRRRGLSSCLVSSEGKEMLHYSTHQGHGSITEDTIALRLLEQMRRYGQLSDSRTEFWVWEKYDATVEVNFQCFKAGSQTSESEGAACLNLLQCLWESCQTRTRSVLLSFSRQKGVLHLKHKHSAVLSLPEVQCHAAVPPSPSSHGKGVWEGLSSIFSHCQRPHIQKHTHMHTHTNTGNTAYLHKQSEWHMQTQTRK